MDRSGHLDRSGRWDRKARPAFPEDQKDHSVHPAFRGNLKGRLDRALKGLLDQKVLTDHQQGRLAL